MKRSAHTQNTPCRPKISLLLGKFPKLNAATLHITQICWELKPGRAILACPPFVPKTAHCFLHHSLAWSAAENKTAHGTKVRHGTPQGRLFSLAPLWGTCNYEIHLPPNLFFLFVLFSCKPCWVFGVGTGNLVQLLWFYDFEGMEGRGLGGN